MKLSSLLKIIGLFAAFISLSAVLLIIFYGKQVDIENNALELQSEYKELGTRMVMASDYLTKEVRHYAQFGDITHYQNYWREVNETKTRDNIVARLIELNVPGQALAYLEEAKANSDALIKLETEAMNAVKNNNFTAARKLLFGKEYEKAKTTIMLPVEKFQQFINEWAGNSVQEIKNKTKLYFVLVQISILLLTLLLISSFLLLFHRIKPLGFLADRLQILAAKEGNLSERLPETGDDEIGSVSKLFNRFIDSLRSMVLNIKDSGIHITTSTTQITASTKQLEATVNENVATTNQIVSAAKEISATSNDLVNTMITVTELSAKTAESAEQGNLAIDQMDSVMKQLNDSLTAISDKLSSINDKAANISKIVLTIEKISDQTNLLSLNAAIEAEKAGEYGKGFAIVAREMRKLADRTDVATLDIQKIVKEMKSAVSEGVMSMDKFTVDVHKGVDEVAVVSEVLSRVIDQVQELIPKFEIVNEGVNSQSHGAELIKESVIQINEAARQTADALGETNNALNQLNEAARNLEAEVGLFTT